MGGIAQKHSKLFRAVDVSGAGIDFVHRWNPPAKHRDQLTNAFSGGGVAVGDYDQDGLPDLFICGQINGGQLFKNLGASGLSTNRLYWNPLHPWAPGQPELHGRISIMTVGSISTCVASIARTGST